MAGGLDFEDLSSLKGFRLLFSIRLLLLLAALKHGTVTLKQETPEAKVTEEATDNHRPEMAVEPIWMIQPGTNIAKQEHHDINRRVAQPRLRDT